MIRGPKNDTPTKTVASTRLSFHLKPIFYLVYWAIKQKDFFPS